MPAYLKPLANTLCFEADEAGLIEWTVPELVAHQHYVSGKRISERSTQYHLRVLEAGGVLELVGGGRGRGHRRRYRLHAERLDTLGTHRKHPRRDPAWPVGEAPRKGATKGATKRCNGPRAPYRTLFKPKDTKERPITNREWRAAKRIYELGLGCRHEVRCQPWTACVKRIVYAQRGIRTSK